MKPLICIFILAAAAALPGTKSLSAQPPLDAKLAGDQLQEKVQALNAQAKALDEQSAAEEQDEKTPPPGDTIPAPPPPKVRAPRAALAGGFGGGGVAPAATPFGQTRLQPIITRGGGAVGKPLVIRSSNPEEKEEANLEEDLAVMAHIFDKSLQDLPGGQPHGFKAAGIDVLFAPGQSPMRCFYLDGYGAVFLLNVSFPLVQPPQKVEREKPPTDSAWTEAQEELFGQPGEGRVAGGAPEEYSEEKVNRLKDVLFDTLKNANNIRGLKPDDSVTVVVFGGTSLSRAKAKAAAKRGWVGQDGDMLALWQDGETQGRQTILTVRVKKADVDAYAKGKLNGEEFQKRARLAAYNSANSGAGFPSVMERVRPAGFQNEWQLH